MKPPSVVAAMRTPDTEVPRARAASAESPTMRSFRPQPVWARAQVSASASATPSGNSTFTASAAWAGLPGAAPSHRPSGSEGICGACGWISGLPR